MPTATVDPWLSTLQRRDAQLVQLDSALTIAVQAALTDVFADLWASVLGARPALVAAASPNLDGLEAAARRSWTGALRRWLRPLVSAAFNRQYAELRPVADQALADTYWRAVVARVDDSIDALVDAVRGTVRDNTNLGIDGLRDQVARVLQLDAVTQGYREDIARVEAQLFDSELSPAERDRLLERRTIAQMAVFQTQAARARSRAFSALAAVAPADEKPALRDLARQAARSAGTEAPARAEIDAIDATLYRNSELTPEQYSTLRQRRRTLYAKAHESAETWRHTAERIARTESTGVLNAATLQSGIDTEAADGVELVKRWIAAHDERTRPTHAARTGADGQIQPIRAPFIVGGSRLDAPGDPDGDPDEVINCRCAIAVLTREENDEITATLAAAGEREPAMTTPMLDTPTVSTELPIGWQGVILAMDTPTGDRRTYGSPADGVLRIREAPRSLLWQPALASGHDGAVVVGNIAKAWIDGNMVMGQGAFDLGSENGREAARLLHEGFLNGVSADLDDLEFTYDDEADYLNVHEWRIMTATMLPQPAFEEARIRPVYASDLDYTLVASLQASAPAVGVISPVSVLTAADFEPPVFEMPTPLTITREGRVFGHLAAWGVCHIGIGDSCVTAPRSLSNYAYFHVGSVLLDDNTELPVGKITLGGGHADAQLGFVPATEHYDDATTSVAVVRASEDQFGIVVCGRMLPNAGEATVQTLRLTPLSGDWRRVGGHLELVAALAVNTPGFVVPRTLAASAAGRQLSLVAAGVVPPRPMEEHAAIEVRRAIRREEKVTRLTARVKLDPKSRVAALAARVIPDNERA